MSTTECPPGSVERIRLYRSRADRGEPLFENTPGGIPLLPQMNEKRLRASKEMEQDNLDRALSLLTSDDALPKIDRRIEKLESELAKLKQLRRAVGGRAKKRTINFSGDKEQALIDYLSEHGRAKPKEIEEAIGISYMTVGKITNSSSKLKKRGNLVDLA